MKDYMERLVAELSRIADGGASYEDGVHAIMYVSQDWATKMRDEINSFSNTQSELTKANEKAAIYLGEWKRDNADWTKRVQEQRSYADQLAGPLERFVACYGRDAKGYCPACQANHDEPHDADCFVGLATVALAKSPQLCNADVCWRADCCKFFPADNPAPDAAAQITGVSGTGTVTSGKSLPACKAPRCDNCATPYAMEAGEWMHPLVDCYLAGKSLAVISSEPKA